MERINFIKRLTRYIILFLMLIIVAVLGNKIVTGKDCSACPGNGICNGETECDNY